MAGTRAAKGFMPKCRDGLPRFAPDLTDQDGLFEIDDAPAKGFRTQDMNQPDGIMR